MRRRIDRSYRHDSRARSRRRSIRARNRQHSICNCELFFAGIEDDVGLHSHGEDDDRRLVGGGFAGVLGIERHCGVPVVVEEGVFVLFGFESGDVGGEKGEVGGHGEEGEGVGEGWGEEEDLRDVSVRRRKIYCRCWRTST